MTTIAVEEPVVVPRETLVATIDKAIELLKGGWTKGCNARKSNGYGVSTFDEMACEYCAYGAMQKAIYGDFDGNQQATHSVNDPRLIAEGCIWRALFDAVGYDPIVFNDNDAQDVNEVIDVFERAKGLV